jgi:hypothetical protein
MRLGGSTTAIGLGIALCLGLPFALPVRAQVPPSAAERAVYTGLHKAAAEGDADAIRRLAGSGADVRARDGNGRTALHVAAHLGRADAMRALTAAGADPRALDAQRYDIVTIAAVNDDVGTLRVALELGADPRAITSPYDGTALIAAAHLGHDEVVRILIRAGAPLDHVNNLGWTALIEAIVLGDGGRRHLACVEALLGAGASPNLADRNGASPLALATGRGYAAMAAAIRRAGGR